MLHKCQHTTSSLWSYMQYSLTLFSFQGWFTLLQMWCQSSSVHSMNIIYTWHFFHHLCGLTPSHMSSKPWVTSPALCSKLHNKSQGWSTQSQMWCRNYPVHTVERIHTGHISHHLCCLHCLVRPTNLRQLSVHHCTTGQGWLARSQRSLRAHHSECACRFRLRIERTSLAKRNASNMGRRFSRAVSEGSANHDLIGIALSRNHQYNSKL